MVPMEMTVNQKAVNTIKVESQISETIARYQTPRGFTSLMVMVMDLLVKLDPREKQIKEVFKY